MSGELEQLGAEAARLDAATAEALQGPKPPEGQGEPEHEKGVDYVGMTAAVLDTAANALGVVYPFVPRHYSPTQNKVIAASIVQLCEAYDVDLTKLLGKAGLWLQVAAAVGMPAVACVAEARKLAAAEEAAKPKPKEGEGGEPKS